MKTYQLIGRPVIADDAVDDQTAESALQKIRDTFNERAKLSSSWAGFKSGAIRMTWLLTLLQLKCAQIQQEEDLSELSETGWHIIKIRLCEESLPTRATPKQEYVFRKAAKAVTLQIEEAEQIGADKDHAVRQIAFDLALELCAISE